ncbi:MAG: hypothetical protein QGI86_25205 [Candidatus Poribacteria bacterium]|nr:hypothetical protein [Candidatus Poribacteria bacterium]MDP6747916.1 hypothetical protein [Candidatus Poribacteria bacterium]MDP6995783.1 hypothetical protein [Candidatus Poribacteria bacterium]
MPALGTPKAIFTYHLGHTHHLDSLPVTSQLTACRVVDSSLIHLATACASTASAKIIVAAKQINCAVIARISWYTNLTQKRLNYAS